LKPQTFFTKKKNTYFFLDLNLLAPDLDKNKRKLIILCLTSENNIFGKKNQKKKSGLNIDIEEKKKFT
jgi:hypothetical protein